MNTEIQKVRDLFVENRNTIKGVFKWDDDMMSLAGSALFTGLGLAADAGRLKECEQILKSRSGALSEFRGEIKLPLLCKMAVSGNPEQYFLGISAIYEKLNRSKIGSAHKLLAAMIICDHTGSADADRYIETTMNIYSRMKEAHKWLTSDDDIPFAAMLAVSGKGAEELIASAEECYPVMKKKFGGSNAEAVQSLCHVLALNKKDTEEKCARVSEIYDGLKTARHKFGVGQELTYLGILAMLDADTTALVEDISEIDDYLKKQKGFGDLSIGSSVRRMYAAMIVMNAYQATGDARQSIDNTLAVSVAIEVSTVLMMTTLMIIWSM